MSRNIVSGGGPDAADVQARRVRDYYDGSTWDYRILWSRHHLHFGYWETDTRSHARSLINMNRQVSERAKLEYEDRVLDAGCGVGGFAVWMAREHAVRVDGITIVESQLQEARRHARRSGVEPLVRFSQKDYTATGFPDASFDAATAIESVCYARDKRDFLAEAYRVLKPGGRLVVCDGYRSGRSSGDDEELMRSWLDGWAIPDLATGEEMTAWARLSGFQDVRLEDIEDHCRPSHYRLYLMAMAAYLPASLVHKLGLRSAVQHGNLRAARDQWRALRRNLWFQGILSARKPANR